MRPETGPLMTVGSDVANPFGRPIRSIANDNTRAAYQRARQNFFAWCHIRPRPIGP